MNTVESTYQKLVDAMVKSLESGKAPWDNGLLNVQINPLNGLYGREYTGLTNLMSLNLAMFDGGFKDPRFTTLNSCRKLKVFPKKGTHATAIIKPITKKIWFEVETKNENGVIEKEKISYVKFVGEKVSLVINIEQLNIPESERDNYFKKVSKDNYNTEIITESNQLLEDLTKEPVVPIIEMDTCKTPCYIPARDKIMMPSKKLFKNLNEYTSTLAHELAHSTGAPNRLNRDVLNRFGSKKYAIEELVAEMTSVFIMNQYGYKATTKNSALYLDSWAHGLKDGGVDMLKALEGQVNLASKYILNADKREIYAKSAKKEK